MCWINLMAVTKGPVSPSPCRHRCASLRSSSLNVLFRRQVLVREAHAAQPVAVVHFQRLVRREAHQARAILLMPSRTRPSAQLFLHDAHEPARKVCVCMASRRRSAMPRVSPATSARAAPASGAHASATSTAQVRITAPSIGIGTHCQRPSAGKSAGSVTAPAGCVPSARSLGSRWRSAALRNTGSASDGNALHRFVFEQLRQRVRRQIGRHLRILGQLLGERRKALVQRGERLVGQRVVEREGQTSPCRSNVTRKKLAEFTSSASGSSDFAWPPKSEPTMRCQRAPPSCGVVTTGKRPWSRPGSVAPITARRPVRAVRRCSRPQHAGA